MKEIRGTILIVDDERFNITVLKDLLDPDYDTMVAKNGLQALSRVSEAPLPDLVLLDIMMPEMDGYEVCKRMKDDPRTANIPIIFISALNQKDDEFKGLELGAVDYITKPFIPDLVLLRVRNHLKIKQMNDRLINMAIKAERANQDKSIFLANISHELRTPMHAILGFSARGMEKGESEKIIRYFTSIHKNGERLLKLINDLLELSKLESRLSEYEFRTNDLAKILETLQEEMEPLFREKNLTLRILPAALSTVCYFDFNKILSVVRNLFSNAIKFSPEQGVITVTFSKILLSEGRRASDTPTIPAIVFSMSDQGVGIPNDEIELIFDKFVQSSKTRSGAGGTGLGLAICSA